MSLIRENRPFEYVSIEHIGLVQNGKEDTAGESVKPWTGAQENYSFTENGSMTRVTVEIDAVEEYKEMFLNAWPKALRELRRIAEESGT